MSDKSSEYYRKFTDPSEVNDWAQKYYGRFLNNQEAPIYKKIYEYTGSSYYPINMALRNLPEVDEEDAKKYARESYWEYLDDAKMIRQYIEEYILPENIVAYRYISLQGLKGLFGSYFCWKGREGKDKGFMSTSLLKSCAQNFTQKDGIGLILKLFIPAGTHALYASQDNYGNNLLREYELLLPPRMKLKVRKNRWRMIECDVIE